MSEESLFHQALAKPVNERPAFLDDACANQPELRAAVEALLAAHEESGPFLEQLVAGATSDHLSGGNPTVTAQPSRLTERAGSMIGPYKLLQQIGEGGMGTVLEAEQDHPVKRRVALKVIKPGMDSAQVIARFEAERQALAMMDHPNIARVFDAGTTDTGRPFFVMELVKGMPITQYCDGVHMPPRERLALFIPVCQAIQHAHQKGVIHRDVKPSNVLITMVDGKPVPKVIDFGVAKAIEQRLTERTMFTQHGAVVGTLEYMSPEQAETSALGVDTRSDIYSLGVLLYELLTGTTPLNKNSIREAAYNEILRRIREEEPPKPSTRLASTWDSAPSPLAGEGRVMGQTHTVSEDGDTLSTIAAKRKTEPAKLSKMMRGELDWIVMKAIEKDRTRRYETANGFARDVQRYLDGDPVEAGPPSATYKLKRFARKHRAALYTAGAFTLLLIAATAVSAALAVWANRERGRAEDREQMAIDAVKRFSNAVTENPELKNNPALESLRRSLLKEPLEFFKKLRDTLQADGDTRPEALARLASAVFELAKLTDEIGSKQDALTSFRESLMILERLAREHPNVAPFLNNLAVAYNTTGLLLSDTGESMQAIDLHSKALEIFERLVKFDPTVIEFRSGLAGSHFNIGRMQLTAGRADKALQAHSKAREIRVRLSEEHPDVPTIQRDLASSHNSMGVLQSLTGEPERALDSFTLAREIRYRLTLAYPNLTSFQRDLAQVYFNTGRLQNERGKPEEALVWYGKATDIFERLASEYPSTTEFKQLLAESHHNSGALHSDAGRRDAALMSFTRALEISEQLARENPSVIRFQNAMAAGHKSIGLLQQEMGQIELALDAVTKALEIRRRLARENQGAVQFQADLASAHNTIGNMQSDLDQIDKALASYTDAKDIQSRLVREYPDVPDYASDLGTTIHNLAFMDIENRRWMPARAKLKQAIAWQKKALASKPNHPTYRQILKNHLSGLIQAANALGNDAEAAEAQRELKELDATDPAKAAIDARLTAVIEGEPAKDNAERLQLAYRAYEKKLHASSARLFDEALKGDPKLADDRQAQHRYNAACAAALAGCGQGKDEPAPDDAAKARLREQALNWLLAELEIWTKLLEAATPDDRKAIVQTLNHWRHVDPDLAGIRDDAAITNLPESEQSKLKKLWSDFDILLANAKG